MWGQSWFWWKYSVYHSTGHVFKKLHTVILLFAVQYVHLFQKLSYVLNLACQKNWQGIITKKNPSNFPIEKTNLIQPTGPLH